MDATARLALGGKRYQAYSKTMRFVGVDLTGATFRMEVRLKPNTPGEPEIALNTVTSAAAEGVRLVGVEAINGKPVSTIGIRINKTTMEGLPYLGELGNDDTFAYDLMVKPVGAIEQAWVEGAFVAQAAVTGATGAPTTYSGYGTPSVAVSAGSSTFQVGDTVVEVSIASGQGPKGDRGDPGNGTIDQDLRDRVVDYATIITKTASFELTSGDYGETTRFAGTADADGILPSARVAGAAGKVFPIIAEGAGVLRLITVENGGGIESLQELILWKGERVTLVSDGNSWIRQMAVSQRFSARLSASAEQTGLSTTPAQLLLDATSGDLSGLNLSFDAAGKCFVARRRCKVQFTVRAPIIPAGVCAVTTRLHRAATAAELAANPVGNPVDQVQFRAGDPRVYAVLTTTLSLNRGQRVAPFVTLSAGTGKVEFGTIMATFEFDEVAS